MACFVAALGLRSKEPKAAAAAQNPRLALLLFELSFVPLVVHLGVPLGVLVTVAQWAGARAHLTHPSTAGRRDAHALSALADSLYSRGVQRRLVMASHAECSYLAQTVY